MARGSKSIVGSLLTLIVVGGIFAVTSLGGCGFVGALFHGNEYSVGYRQGYVTKQSYKQGGGWTGLDKMYELELTFHGRGGGKHVGKKGQGEGGAWYVNHESEKLRQWIEDHCWVQTETRVYYVEKHVTVEGLTCYRVLGLKARTRDGEVEEYWLDKGEEVWLSRATED
jgi:hypothetical protein